MISKLIVLNGAVGVVVVVVVFVLVNQHTK